MAKSELTPKQLRFVKEYMVDLNGKQAAIRAGYSPRSAEMHSSRLLSYDKVRAAVVKENARVDRKLEISAERTLLETSRLSSSNLKKLYDENGNLKPIHELEDDIAACISGIEVVTTYRKDTDGNMIPEYTKKYKLWDKNSALERMHRHFNLSPDRKEHTGAGGQPLFPVSTGDERARRGLAMINAELEDDD